MREEEKEYVETVSQTERGAEGHGILMIERRKAEDDRCDMRFEQAIFDANSNQCLGEFFSSTKLAQSLNMHWTRSCFGSIWSWSRTISQVEFGFTAWTLMGKVKAGYFITLIRYILPKRNDIQANYCRILANSVKNKFCWEKLKLQ